LIKEETMSRRRRRWRRYGRPTGVIINADRVIITRDEEDEPPGRPTTSIQDLILGAMAGMLLMRLIDIGRAVVLQ
jgi:hypothetical protein